MDERNSDADDDIRMDATDPERLDFITDTDRDAPSLLRIRPSKHSKVPLKPLYLNSDPLNWQRRSLPYVTHLTHIENSIVAAFSSPSDSFSCFDPTTLAATRGTSSGSIWGHAGGITKIRNDREQNSLFWSSGMDGRIGCHDLRQPNPLTGL